MPKPTLALTLLSLSTTTEKASEIEGDLIEQSRTRGKRWLKLHVALTTLALIRQAVLQNPVFVFLLSYGAYELMMKTFFWVIRPLRNYLIFEIDMPRIPIMSGIYLLTIFLTFTGGAVLIRYLPRFGIQAVVGAGCLVLLRVIVLREYSAGHILLFGVLPLILGSLFAQWMNLRQEPVIRAA